jgi:hypothetical protein
VPGPLRAPSGSAAGGSPGGTAAPPKAGPPKPETKPADPKKPGDESTTGRLLEMKRKRQQDGKEGKP